MDIAIPVISNNNSAYKNKVSFGYSFFLKDVTLPCAYCGKKMLSIKNIATMAKHLDTRTGNDAIAVLHNHYRNLDKKQQIIIDILSQEIKKQPETPVKDIVESLARRFEATTNYQYSQAVSNAFESSAINVNSPLREILDKIIEHSKKSLLSNIVNSKQKTLRITDLRENLIKLINSSGSEEEKTKLRKFMQIINSDFDYIKQDPHSFFAKFGYEPMKSFLGSLFSSIRSTADHIVTASRNGPSDSSNYIAVCGMCNWARSEEPFKDFIKRKPKIISNIKKQFAVIDSMLSPEFTRKQHTSIHFTDNILNYLSAIQKTLREETGKPFEVNLPNFQSKIG